MEQKLLERQKLLTAFAWARAERAMGRGDASWTKAEAEEKRLRKILSPITAAEMAQVERECDEIVAASH